jgi:acyl-CoA thioesterase-1
MRRWVMWLWLLWLAWSPAQADTRTILVVGDSLSAAFGFDINKGWVALLQQRLAEQRLDFRVVNASISGDTTAGGLARLPKLLAQHRPAIVILELGANDGLRGLSPEQMKHNISRMIAQAQAQGARVLLVGTEIPSNYGARYIERFRKAYRDVAAKAQVPLVPFLLEGVALDPAFIQADRLHPNEKAQPRMLENVWGQLRPLLM